MPILLGLLGSAYAQQALPGAVQISARLAQTPFDYGKLSKFYSDIHLARVTVNASGQVTSVTWKPEMPNEKVQKTFDQHLTSMRVRDTSGTYSVSLYLCTDSSISKRLTQGIMPFDDQLAPGLFDFRQYDEKASRAKEKEDLKNKEVNNIIKQLYQNYQFEKETYRLLIDAKGDVVFAYCLTRSNEKFYPKAQPLMMHLKFSPFRIAGQAVPGWVDYPFKLQVFTIR